MDSSPRLAYAGWQMQEALSKIQTSLEKLEKRGRSKRQPANSASARLKTIVSLHEEKKEALLRAISKMREWVVEAEHIFDGSLGKSTQKRSGMQKLSRRFEAYLGRLSCFLEAEERTDDEDTCV